MVNGPIEVGLVPPTLKALPGNGGKIGHWAPMKAEHGTCCAPFETQTNPSGTVSYRVAVVAGPVFWTAITYNTGDPSPIPVPVNW